jgi:nitrous oxidase accessory protein NosD
MRIGQWHVTVLGLICSATFAAGAKIEVMPGPGTPLQDAIDAAPATGATLLLQEGTYNEAVTIDKRLTIRLAPGAASGAGINAGCMSPDALRITADGVRILGTISVAGGTARQVVIENADSVRLERVSGRDTCGMGGIGLAVTASDRVKVSRGQFRAGGTACLIEGIGLGSKVLLDGANCLADGLSPAGVGVHFKDCGNGALAPGRGGVRMKRSQFFPAVQGEARGIILENSDGVSIEYVQIRVNDAPDSKRLDIDATSDNNRFACPESDLDATSGGVGNCYTNCKTFFVPPLGMSLCQ